MSDSDRLQALNRLIGALVPANRFYAAKLKGAGLEGGVTSLDEFSLRMPFTTKQEIVDDQRAHPPFGSNLTYRLARYTRFTQTSGTSGAPLRWLDTPESWSWMLDCWTRVFAEAGVNPGDRIYFAFSFGPFLGFWTAFESAARLGCLCIPGGGLSSGARLRAILDNSVEHLCCTPTYALRLGLFAEQERIDLRAGRVRTIIVAGEPGGGVPATRARIAALWNGVRVFDHHGMTEIGPVSHECADEPGSLCVIDSAYLAEVVDPRTGAAPADGCAGELVLTNLGRTGSPLLRYRTGDMVRMTRRDGRNILHGGILGRVDDMVIVRGVNVYPTAVEQILRGCPDLAEYQVKVRESEAQAELEVVIEPTVECPDPPAMAARLESDLRDVLALRIPVSIAPPGALPRFEMKAQRWQRAPAPRGPACSERTSCAECDSTE